MKAYQVGHLEPLVHFSLEKLIFWPEEALVEFAFPKHRESEKPFLLLLRLLLLLVVLQLLLLLRIGHHSVLRPYDAFYLLFTARHVSIVFFFILDGWLLQILLDHCSLQLELFEDVGVP